MTDLAAQLGLLAVLGGLFGLDRRAAFQLMLSQPVVAVPALGLVFGHFEQAAWLGAVLQLLWMSAVLFGASTPPNETVGALTAAGIALLYGRLGPVDERTLALAVLIAVPLSLVGRRLDQAVDRANLALAKRADAAAQAGEWAVLERQPLIGLGRVFILHALLIGGGTAAGLLLVWLLHPALGPGLNRVLATTTIYLLPALGVAVTLSTLRRRVPIGLALAGYVGLLLALTSLHGPGA